MSWIFLIIAGLFEAVWSLVLKSLAEDLSWKLFLSVTIFLTASMVFLTLAMRILPLSIAYPVWTGVGSLGAVLIGNLLFGEALSGYALTGIGLIALGTFLICTTTH